MDIRTKFIRLNQPGKLNIMVSGIIKKVIKYWASAMDIGERSHYSMAIE